MTITANQLYHQMKKARPKRRELLFKRKFFRYDVKDDGSIKLKKLFGKQIFGYMDKQFKKLINPLDFYRYHSEFEQYVYFTEKELLDKQINISNHVTNIDNKKVSINNSKRNYISNSVDQLPPHREPQQDNLIEYHPMKRVN